METLVKCQLRVISFLRVLKNAIINQVSRFVLYEMFLRFKYQNNKIKRLFIRRLSDPFEQCS